MYRNIQISIGVL
jgi:solute carrier family 44 (choline transporter-like protein), member 2/4/5